MPILKEPVGDLAPLKKGGVTFYPAHDLGRVFEWAEGCGRKLEWVEGLFYDASTGEGQLSLGYICARGDAEYEVFRQTCLDLVDQMEVEASSIGMDAYFEIGISDCAYPRPNST